MIKVKSGLPSLVKRDILMIIGSVAGAFITYLLNTELNTGAVLAAGVTGLFGSFLPFLNQRSQSFKNLPAAIYCGAFAGMTAEFLAEGFAFIILAGTFSGLLLIFSKETLNGFGGKLGTIAFGGVAAMTFILFLIS
ncbi:hypothetical protein [Christiangramia sabulilitoris]|uniref:ZIP family metal transporter n=1 Tax=Christiangramia sabulilitoris TaxID=2583991 RepID=A0A550HXC9_9FLAO|nr:hypothetical protein [Christiangramia sabulilitoris]TRO63325.1 hypothetical protein FGM01_13745 [Christiangramia sabulilitoris]